MPDSTELQNKGAPSLLGKRGFFPEIYDITELHKKGVFSTRRILKELIPARCHLAELKGLIPIIPNDKILISNLTLQEAKDSSAIENIVTTQDSIYRHRIKSDVRNTANQEIYRYRKALEYGCNQVKSLNGISRNVILEIQKILEPNRSGFRKVTGTVLKNTFTKETIYTPPSPEKIPEFMDGLERFINTDREDMDPLVKMSVIHHWFESIHPFYDGNGRTGRIVNILYIVLKDLLKNPVLCLSRYIHQNRSDYYRLLQQVREENDWEDWIVYILKGVSATSRQTAILIGKIDELFKSYKQTLRGNYKFYSHDLINHIFCHPYTKIKFLMEDMNISRATATRYLDKLSGDILEKRKLGRESYYVNEKMCEILKRF